MAGCAVPARSPPPEEAAQDAAFQRLQQRALPGPRVPEQLQFDSGLDALGGPQLLDEAQLEVVLAQKERKHQKAKRDVFLLWTLHRFYFSRLPNESSPPLTRSV